MRLPLATAALSFCLAACSSSTTYQGGPPPENDPDEPTVEQDRPDPRRRPAPQPVPQPVPEAPRADVPVEEVVGPSTAATLGIPPGHLPDMGECRIWIPGTPPGRQDRARSCYGAIDDAPANAMVLEGLSDDRRLVRVFYIGDRPNTVDRIVIFEKQTGQFVRNEAYQPPPPPAAPRPAEPPTADRPPPPPRPTPNRQRTEPQPPPRPVTQPPPPPPSADVPALPLPASLEIAQGQLPDPGECRVWIPGTRPGRQAKADSCDGAVAGAPAGTMVLEGMPDESDHVRVTYIGERAGNVARVLIFERRTGKFVREEG